MGGRKDYKYENKIDGWLDGWIQKQMNSWMDRKKIYEKIGGWLDVQETQKDGWLDGQKNRWLNGQKKLMAEWI